MGEQFMQRLKKAKLTGRERIIAEKITGNLSRAAFLAGPQLAQKCGVSASAITRFAQKLGYSGFPEMKLDLEDLFRQTITPYEMFREFLAGPRKQSIAQESIAQDVQNLMDMQHALNEQRLEQVITNIEQGRAIYAAAIAASEVAVHLLCFYLDVLGKANRGLFGHGLSKQLEVTEIGTDDVFVAMSYQRIYREVRDAAVFAKEKGAYTVAITDSAVNALTPVCDDILIAPVTGASFGYTHVAPVAMVNVLVNSLAARNPEQSLKELERMKNFWDTTKVFCSDV